MKQVYLKRVFLRLIFALNITCLFILGLKAQSLEENYNSESVPSNMIIKGKVLEASTTQALELASLRLFNQKDSSFIGGTVTNEQGLFQLAVKPGLYYLEVQYVSYESKYISNIRLNTQTPSYNVGTVKLSSDSQALDEVEIIGQRDQVELDVDKRVYNVGRDPSNAGSNAAQILDNLPSIQVDVDGNISLRGSNNVRILIDGRPSGLAGLDNPDALRLLQGNLIERIEVITNPSARYEAEGEVGIINIILKKDRRKGLNGSFDVNTGLPTNHGAAFSLNYRKGVVNLFGSYGINYRRFPGSGLSLQRFTNPEDEIGAFRTDRDQTRGGLNNTIRFGSDFFITKKLTITTSALYRFSDENNEVDIVYDDFDLNDALLSRTVRNQDEDEDDENIEFSFSLDKRFERKGQRLTFDFKYLQNNDTEFANTIERNLDLDSTTFQKIFNVEDEENIFLQLDYVHPFGENAKFETGYRSTFRTIDNDYELLQSINNPDNFVSVPDFTNDFIYQEDIYAVYAIISNKYERLSWQVGLRAEYTDIIAELNRTGEANNRDFFNLFPSASLSYKPNPQNTYQISYSRRITRPRFRSLLPFPGLSDSRNFFSGNPALNPEFTHSGEISYVRNWKTGNFLTSYYYRYRTGVIQRITITDEDGFNSILPVNLSTEQATGFEFSIQQDILPWWSINGDFNFYRSVIDGSYEREVEGEMVVEDLSAEAYTWNTRFVSKIELKKLFDFQANVFYRAPRNSPQGRTKSLYSINLGFSRDILKKKGTITLSVRDLLNSFKWRSFTETFEFTRDSEFQWRARQVSLNFNYRLNQKKRRGRRGRPSGNYRGGDEGGF